MKILYILIISAAIAFSNDLNILKQDNSGSKNYFKDINPFYKAGVLTEFSNFKSELQNRSGLFEVVNVNPSQTKRANGFLLSTGLEIDEYRYALYFTRKYWDNANSNTIGLSVERDIMNLNILDYPTTISSTIKIGHIKFDLDKLSNDRAPIYALEGYIKYKNMNFILGYNYTDVEVSKIYAIGGSAKQVVKYKGGFIFSLLFENSF